MNRRFFLKVSLGGAGALLIGCGANPPPWGGAHMPQSDDGLFDANAWIRIHPDERIEVAMTKAEMGQGSHTLAAILVAEELEVPVDRITPVAAVGPQYELNGLMQITGGSTSTPELWKPMRHAGAAARIMLVQAAAKTWGVPAGECSAADGAVTHAKSNRSLTYGKLTAAAAKITPPQNVPLKARKDFKVIGTNVDRIDLREKVTGAPIFGIDVQVPDMVNAALVPPPVYGSTPTAVDDAEIRKMPGVIDVLSFDFGVAVIASRYWQARRAADALKITWSKSHLDDFDSAKMLADMLAAVGEEGPEAQSKGDIEEAFETSGAQVLEASYSGPYLAHATLEPQTATAWVRGDEVDIWTGTQAQTSARNTAARIAGVDPANVTLHNTYLGGGFGRRGCIDAVIQAVMIATRVDTPVKLTWSRENDTRGWYYRPQMVARMKGSVKDGAVTGFYAHCASQTPGSVPDLISQVAPGWLSEVMLRIMGRLGAQLFDSGTVPNMLALEGMTSHAYTFENQRIDFSPVKGAVPTLFWRSVGHSFNPFAKEGFMDELAHAAGVDAYAFRRKHLAKDDRRLGVLDAVAKLSKWDQKPAEGIGRGIGAHFSFGSFVGMVSEARVVDGDIKVERVYATVDCGQPINRDQIIAQVESAIVFALGAALYGRIDVADGKVVQGNFHDFRILRMNECPEIVCEIIDSTESPTGMGEPGVPLVAPTVANAVFELTGKRLRDMPLVDALATAMKEG